MKFRTFGLIVLLVLLAGIPVHAKTQTMTQTADGKTTTAEGSWVRKKKHYQFRTKDGKILKGWLLQGTKKYYCEQKNGYRLTGLKKIDGKWYFFRKNGSAAVSAWYAKGKTSGRYSSKASRSSGKKSGKKSSGKNVVSTQNVDDCDGSGHGTTIITYSDGSTSTRRY